MEEKIFDNDFFRRLNKINLNVNLRLSNGAQGGRKSKSKGVSVEFSDFREYTPGDDFRRVDWNAYGRFDKLFIKVFMEEREGVFNLFIDKSKSMDFGKNNKRKTALQILGALSYVALNNLDRVYINVADEGNLSLLRSGTGKKGFQMILKELEKIEFNGATRLSESICKRKITNKGVSVIVSDFFNNEGVESLEQGLKYLAYKKQQIILIQVLAEEEENPSLEEEITLIDSETKEKIKLNLNYKMIQAYKEELKKYNEKLEKLAMKYGGTLVAVNTNKSIEEIILNDLGKKRIIYWLKKGGVFLSITNLWPLGLLSIIPIVILLYILKRKYKEKEIPSSLLWKEAYKNTQANTPWEKLKVNIMMIIQIIIFLILILALMNPFLNFGGKQYTNLIVAIDNTASMSTLYEYDKSRLDEAKELSKEYIKSINYNTNNFIIEYDGNSNFQTKNSIDDITQGYGSGDISEILSYIRSLGDGLGEYELLLISDKDIDLGDINGKAISLANSGQNAAITNMSHKFVDDKIQIIATIANTGEGDYNGDFSLYNESQLLEVKTIELPKGESITLNYTLENYEGKYIKGELSKKDLISEDNIYYDVIKKLRSKKVLLVTDKNVFLEKGLNGIENIELYKTNDVANITDDYYDLYVFDNVMPKSMPFSGNILFINPESNEFFNVEDKNELSEVTGVKDTLSKYTANMKFIVSSYKNIVMPYYGHPLLKINDDNAGFIGESNGRKIAALGFDIHNSDVALKKEFPILIYELGKQLIESGVLYKNNYKGGDDILINGTSQAENIQITLPNRKIKDIDPGTTYNNITELGIYKVSEKQATGEALEELFSINFPSDSESDLSNENLIETSNIQSESKVLKKGLSIVPFILLLALIGLIIEYVLYLRGN